MDDFSKYFKKNLFFLLVASFALSGMFALGFFIANVIKFERPPIVVDRIAQELYSTSNVPILQGQGTVVASVNSDKYHAIDCPGAKSIKEENKMYFNSANEAMEAGFTLAGNCKI